MTHLSPSSLGSSRAIKVRYAVARLNFDVPKKSMRGPKEPREVAASADAIGCDEKEDDADDAVAGSDLATKTFLVS